MSKFGLLGIIALMLPTSADAVDVRSSPSLFLGEVYRVRSDGEFVDGRTSLEDLSIVASQIHTSTTGSGTASADLESWRIDRRGASARLSASTNAAPGSATASVLSVSTFDIVFPRKGEFFFEIDYAVSGGGGGQRPTESASAIWNVFFEFDPGSSIGFGGFNPAGDFNSVRCPGSLCPSFFDDNATSFSVFAVDNLRLPVRAVIDFTVSATTISEPNYLSLTFIVIGSLMLVYRKTATCRSTSITNGARRYANPASHK